MSGAFDADRFAADLEAESGFETDCLRARQASNLRRLRQFAPARILEVGCGADLLFDRAVEAAIDFEAWTVVEPAAAFADLCRARASQDKRLKIVQSRCEELPPGEAGPPFDAAILSSVLHHAPDPRALLLSALRFLRSGGQVLVNTPNALSFHRLLAVEMGLIAEPGAVDARALRMQKTTIFDPASLAELLTSCGVRDLDFEGYMFKPFAHEQMAQILPLLGPTGAAGLEALGRRFGANAAEIAYAGIKARGS